MRGKKSVFPDFRLPISSSFFSLNSSPSKLALPRISHASCCTARQHHVDHFWGRHALWILSHGQVGQLWVKHGRL